MNTLLLACAVYLLLIPLLSLVVLYLIGKWIKQSEPLSVIVHVREAPKHTAPQDADWREKQIQALKDRGMWPVKEDENIEQR